MLFDPMKFEPIFKERIWGSDRLQYLFGKKLPAGKSIGESWELADLAGDGSMIRDGALAGKSLREVLDKYGSEIGFTQKQVKFPFGLLIKYLDANKILSVQVHPHAEVCRQFLGAQPKTECWYVLEAESEAVIYRGLKEGVGRKDVEKAVTEGMVEQLMEVYPARKGDTHFLPAGTIHTIGAGVIVVEIQTPSDTTYRLYDWNRIDKEGKGRELHIEQALSSIRYTDGSAKVTPENEFDLRPTEELYQLGQELGEAEILAQCPFFSVVHLTSSAIRTHTIEITQPTVMINLKGTGTVGNAQQEENAIDFAPGDTLLLPWMKEAMVEVEQDWEVLLVCLGPKRAS